jgi:hypothetical protein
MKISKEIELLESTSPDGPIAKHIEKNGESLQHLALHVDNIEAARGSPLSTLSPRAAFCWSSAKEKRRDKHSASIPIPFAGSGSEFPFHSFCFFSLGRYKPHSILELI